MEILLRWLLCFSSINTCTPTHQHTHLFLAGHLTCTFHLFQQLFPVPSFTSGATFTQLHTREPPNSFLLPPNQQFSAASFPSQLSQMPLPAHPVREHGAKGSRRTEPPVLLHQSLVPDISDWNNLGRRVRFAPVLEVLNTTNFHH